MATSKAEQPIDLDDERAVLQVGKSRREGVALLVVDDEQLAARAGTPTAAARSCSTRLLLELYWTSALANISGVIV